MFLDIRNMRHSYQELHRERETKEELFFIVFFFPQQQLPIVFVHPQFILFFSAPIISSAAVFFLSLSSSFDGRGWATSFFNSELKKPSII